MASGVSSSDVGAPDGGRAATNGASGVSSPVYEAALDKLVERALAAVKSGRYSFAASLWGRAVAAATEFYGDSLVAVKCKLEQTDCLTGQAYATLNAVEKAAVEAESWALVSSVLPLLSARMNDNTLLPAGRCTKMEVEFQNRFMLVKCQVDNKPALSARDLQLVGFGVGYDAAMSAARHALFRRVSPSRPHEASELMTFVLRAVDMVRSLCHLLSR